MFSTMQYLSYGEMVLQVYRLCYGFTNKGRWLFRWIQLVFASGILRSGTGQTDLYRTSEAIDGLILVRLVPFGVIWRSMGNKGANAGWNLTLETPRYDFVPHILWRRTIHEQSPVLERSLRRFLRDERDPGLGERENYSAYEAAR
jgi:hypothetical protein